MPADGYVVTPELQFEARVVTAQRPDLGAGIAENRVVRILQQRWVRAGTMWGEPFTDENSEWRDVPMAGEIEARRALGLPDYEKPPLGQPPSWLQEQERKDG